MKGPSPVCRPSLHVIIEALRIGTSFIVGILFVAKHDQIANYVIPLTFPITLIFITLLATDASFLRTRRTNTRTDKMYKP